MKLQGKLEVNGVRFEIFQQEVVGFRGHKQNRNVFKVNGKRMSKKFFMLELAIQRGKDAPKPEAQPALEAVR